MPGTSGTDAENQGVAIISRFREDYTTRMSQIDSVNKVIASCQNIIDDLYHLGKEKIF